MSFKYEPASEPLHISVKWLFINLELCRTVPIWCSSRVVHLAIESCTDLVQLSIPEFFEWSVVAHKRCTNVEPLRLTPLGGDAGETPRKNGVPQ